MREVFYYNSPIGTVQFEINNSLLVALKFTNIKINNFNDLSDLDTPFSTVIKKELDEYFKGERKYFDIPLNPQGTSFQKNVWTELLNIPYGTTKTYKNIAQLIDNPNSARAIGNTCHKNKIAIIIPCHRVISSNGKLNGFAYGVECKKFLIQLEEQHA